MPTTFDVFISHSSDDTEWVRDELVPALRLRELRVVVDFEFEAGVSRDENIFGGIDASRHFLAVLTDQWFGSKWCQDELAHAKLKDKEIHPLQRKTCAAGSQSKFGGATFLDLSNASTNSDAIQRLFVRLGAASKHPDREAWSLVAARCRELGAPISAPCLPVESGGAGCPRAVMDLGTTWGVPRTSFVGILAAPPSVPVLDTLLRAERTVTEAQFQRLANRLPDRWWLDCSASNRPDGPGALSHIWDSARNVRLGSSPGELAGVNPLASALRKLGDGDNGRLPRDIKLGLFFQVDARNESGQAAVENWLVRLREILPSRSYCAVVHLAGDAGRVALDAAVRLATRARSRFDSLARPESDRCPIEVCDWRGPVPPGVSTASAKSPVNAWVDEALSRDPRATGRFGELVQEAERIRLVGNASNLPAGLVTALDRAGVDPKIDRDLLALVAECLPERMEGLVCAYAFSTRLAARREAMKASTGRDAWLDAFVAQVDWSTSEALSPEFLGASAEVAFVDDVVLGLLRRAAGGGGTTPVQTALETLADRVSQSVGRLCRAVVQGKAVALQEDTPARGWTDLARSGLTVFENDFRRLAEDCDGVWWWNMALPPDRARISATLGLRRNTRAVLGLLSDEEHSALCEDEERLAVVRRRRRSRTL